MIKKLSALIATCVLFVTLAWGQQGFKISQYPQITTVPGNYLFIVANPGISNASVSYANLAAQLTQNISLANATNNDVLTSNQLYSILYSTMVTYVNAATNPFSGGSFIITLNGYGTNLNLFGTNVVSVIQGSEIDVTNAVFTQVTPLTIAVYDSLKHLTNFPNAAGVLQNDGSGVFSWVVGPPPGGSAGGVLSGTYPSPAFSYSVVTNGMAAAVTVSNNFRVDATHALVSSNATASKLASFDALNQLTNATTSSDLSFSGNVLGIAAGAEPTLNLDKSTNLLLSAVVSPTNGVSTASSIDFAVPEATTNIAGAVSQTSMVNFNPTNYNHAIRYYINRTGSDQTITVGTWETDSGRQTSTTYINTNNTTLALMYTLIAGQTTNVTSYKTFR